LPYHRRQDHRVRRQRIGELDRGQRWDDVLFAVIAGDYLDDCSLAGNQSIALPQAEERIANVVGRPTGNLAVASLWQRHAIDCVRRDEDDRLLRHAPSYGALRLAPPDDSVP